MFHKVKYVFFVAFVLFSAAFFSSRILAFPVYDYTLPVPVIYQTSFGDGQKTVYGKIVPNGIDVRDIEILAYFTDSTDITKPAENITEYIGKSEILINQNGKYIFIIKEQSVEGGFVAVFTKNKLTGAVSQLSNPLENSTFTVDSSADGTDDAPGDAVCATAGAECTLRAAISESNALAGPDNIYFNIDTSDPGFIAADGSRASTVEPAGTYPVTPNGYFTLIAATNLVISSTDGTIIDGYTQSLTSKNSSGFGQTLNSVIRIQIIKTGSAGQPVFNITGASGGVHITGLNFFDSAVSASAAAVQFLNSSNNRVYGNYIGTNINGENMSTTAYGKILTGDTSTSTNNIVGTNGDGVNDITELNVISGGAQLAMVHFGTSALTGTGNVIAGNYIRTDKTGKTCATIDSTNDRTAVHINPDGIRVGTNNDGVSDSLEGNIIGCVRSAHRAVVRAWSNNMIFKGNYINMHPDGTVLTPVHSAKAAIDIIGDGGMVEDNHILSYTTAGSSGIDLGIVAATTNTTVKENVIKSGTYGIQLRGAGNHDINGNIITETSGAGIYFPSETLATTPNFAQIHNNQIYSNTGYGIWNVLLPGSAVRIDRQIFQNKIYSNTLLPINIVGGTEDGNAVTANDSNDADIGLSYFQNFPVINSATFLGSGQYKLNGEIDNTQTGEGPFDLEICESEASASSHGGCVNSLFFTADYVTQNTSGVSAWEAIVTVPGSTGVDSKIFTALATNTNGSTSEFSLNFTASVSSPDYLVGITLVSPVNNATLTDSTPLFDWQPSVDSTVKEYKLYLNSALIATVSKDFSEYQYAGKPLYGSHILIIDAIRNDNSVGGTSGNISFAINPVSTLTIDSPKGGTTMTNTNVTFKWVDSANTKVMFYDVYLNEQYYKSITKVAGTVQSLGTVLGLGNYSWQVVGYYMGINSLGAEIAVESGRSSKETFSIVSAPVSLPVSFPVSSPVSQNDVSVTEPVSNSAGNIPEIINEVQESTDNTIAIVAIAVITLPAAGFSIWWLLKFLFTRKIEG